MLKRTYLSIGVVAVLGIVVVAAIAQIISMKNNKSTLDIKGKAADGTVYKELETTNKPVFQEKEAPLDMKVKLVSGAVYTTGDAPLDIIFRNNADEPVKLLNLFDDPKAKKILFNVTLRDSSESPIFINGGGKIALSQDSMKYIELKKGEETLVKINLTDFVPENYSLKPGVYSVIITYRNQYGENCFRGTLESKSLNLVLIK
ncbi:MAG: hypothetical protein M3449_08165 [Acidobacteriota bacterium]|nr:hypothetical protein [Acidobacteriota bacterium]